MYRKNKTLFQQKADNALSPDGTLPLGSLAGKRPIIVGTVARHFPPLLQHLGEQRIHRDRLGRGFSLAPADNTNNRTHDTGKN
jgi:hypothetical protein